MRLRLGKVDLFYIMVIIISFNQSISDTSIFTLYGMIKPLIIGVICVLAGIQVISIRKIKTKQIILWTLLACSIYTSIVVENTWMIYIFVISLFLADKDIKKIVKCIIYPSAIIFMVNCGCFFWNFIFNSDSLEYIVQYETDIRYFMNYNSPNGAGRILIFIVLGYLYILNRKVKMIENVIAVTITVLIYAFTRTDALILVPIILLLYNFKDKIECIIMLASKMAYWIEMIVSYLFIIFSSTNIAFVFDTFLVGRMTFSLKVLGENGFSLLGQKIDLGYQYIESDIYKLTCDNGFYYIPIVYGGVYLIFMSLVVIYITKTKVDTSESICYLIYFLYMFIENRIFDFPSVFPLLLMIAHWSENKELDYNVMYKGCINKKQKRFCLRI